MRPRRLLLARLLLARLLRRRQLTARRAERSQHSQPEWWPAQGHPSKRRLRAPFFGSSQNPGGETRNCCLQTTRYSIRKKISISSKHRHFYSCRFG
jgi:hypothetical protein